MSHGRKIARVKLNPPKTEDSKRYLLSWKAKELYHHLDRFPPLNRQTLFDSVGPMQLEIGCGTGEFICNLAEDQENNKFVGIDFSRRAIYSAVNLAATKGLKNIKFIQADFKQLYPLLTSNSLDRIFLHFPDPNYKTKHLKHRIFDKTFLNHMNYALTLNGKISVVTDQERFFIDMLTIAEEDHRFKKNHPERFLTIFEPQKKSRFHLAWERIDQPYKIRK
jgi:tRNA (guanine-N7-)-methyltransferase